MIARIVFASVLTAVPASALAQDNHFNTNAYGSRSSLYGGAVVGGARDSSAAYYNPGGLAFIDDANLSVNASIYRIGRISVEDGAGTGERLGATPVEMFPGIVSGVVLFDDLPGHVFGYSLITRHSFDLSATARLEDVKNVIDDARGKLKEETSVGLTYSIGRNHGEQVANFAGASEGNLLFGQVGEANAAYDVVGLLIGYTRYF